MKALTLKDESGTRIHLYFDRNHTQDTGGLKNHQTGFTFRTVHRSGAPVVLSVYLSGRG